MCVVSQVMDYGWKRIPDDMWNETTIDQFRRLLEEARKFDKVADQPECEDPEKAKLLDKLDAIEKQLEENIVLLEKNLNRLL